MADISKIIDLQGNEYNIKDAAARDAIAGINSFEYLKCTEAGNTPYGVKWGNPEVTGTLAASASTKNKIYLVPKEVGDNNIFEEYITVQTGESTFVWEMFGDTEVRFDDLGDLAVKDTASASYTPAGTVAAPGITVTPTTVAKYVAGSATGGGSVSAGSAAQCTLPVLTTTVENETLTIGWSAGSFTANTPTAVTLPTFSEQTIMTAASAEATAPAFTGTAATITVS